MASVTKLMTSAGELLRSKLLSSGVCPGLGKVEMSLLRPDSPVIPWPKPSLWPELLPGLEDLWFGQVNWLFHLLCFFLSGL